jgi:hypothetical protein
MEESRFFAIVCFVIIYHIILAYLIHFYVIYSIDNFKRALAVSGKVWDAEDFFLTRGWRAVKQVIEKIIRKLRELSASFK